MVKGVNERRAPRENQPTGRNLTMQLRATRKRNLKSPRLKREVSISWRPQVIKSELKNGKVSRIKHRRFYLPILVVFTRIGSKLQGNMLRESCIVGCSGAFLKQALLFSRHSCSSAIREGHRPDLRFSVGTACWTCANPHCKRRGMYTSRAITSIFWYFR